MKWLFTLLLILSFLWHDATAQKGYEIKVKIKSLADSTLILGHHFAKSMYPDDTLKLDKNGAGSFKGKEALPGGMYIIFLPAKNYFDIIVDDNEQHFTVENDTSDLFKKVKFIGSKQNQLFYEYQYFLSEKREQRGKILDDYKSASSKADKDKIAQQVKDLDNEVKNYTKKIVDENPGTFIAKFVQGTLDIEVPEPPRDSNNNIIDSLFQYRYYKRHFFDNLDISDVRLLRSPIYEDKLMTYLDKVIPQMPDSINNEVDFLIAKSRTSPELFRYMLVTLFNHYGQSQIMGFDGIALYIADKYYLKEATWSDTAYIKKLQSQVTKQLPLVLGKKAPDVQLVFVPSEHFIVAADSSKEFKRNPYVGSSFNLYQLRKRFVILYFWEADCGHCKKATPVMYDVAQKLKAKDVEVVSINLLFGEDGKEKWVNFVNEHKLYDWINAWNPYSYKFKEQFDIASTPTIYILDKDKKIVAKRIGPEQCEEIIDHLIEVEDRNK